MMFKLWMVCSLVGLTVAGEGSPVPISEEAVVKSDRVGNNFAYSIRHEQRSVIPAGSGPVSATPLSAHPVNVPNVYSSSGTSGSSSSASAASGGTVHQFKSATASSSAVAGSASQQHQQQQQQQLHHRQQDEQQHHQQQQQHHQQQHDQHSNSGIVSVPGVSGVSVVSGVPSVSSNAVVQTPPGAVAAPVIYQQLALPLRTQVVSQPAGVEVLQAPAVPAAAVGVYPPAALPAAVGVFHYPSPTGAALVGSTATELVHDSTKLMHQPPTFFVAQVAPSSVYNSPEPVAHPAFYTPAVYPAEVARPEALKFIDASTLKLADGSALKWADASTLKWTDAPAVKWTEVPAQKWGEASALKWADNSAHKFADAAVLKFDASSPLRFAEPAGIRYSDSVKYVDASGSKYAASDSSATKFTSGSGVSDNKVAADSSAKASEVALISGAHLVKSESEKQEASSSSSESQSAKLYSAPAFFASAPFHQQAFYADSPRQYYSAGVVQEPPTFYAATARIAHQPIYSPVPVPVPVQQTIVPNFELHALHDKAQVRGFSLPTRQVHYATARQPTFVTGVHQASGLSSSHEAHSQSSSAKIY